MAGKLDDERLKERVIALVRAGNHPNVAAIAAGLSRRTFGSWRRWAREGRPEYVEFFDALDRAQNESEAHDVVTTRRAASIDPVPVRCPNCQADVNLDPLELIAMAGHLESTQRVKASAAAVALERLSRRFPNRWSPRMLHEIQSHDRLLDVAQRTLEADVFELLLEKYLASESASEVGGDSGEEVPDKRVH